MALANRNHSAPVGNERATTSLIGQTSGASNIRVGGKIKRCVEKCYGSRSIGVSVPPSASTLLAPRTDRTRVH